MNPYASSRAALAAAARLTAHLDVQPRRTDRVQQTASGEQHDGPIAVRTAMRAAGLDPDGAEAALLYAWALDELDELGEGEAEGVAELLGRVGAELEALGVVARAPKLRLIRIGWRVLELDGRRQVLVVTDPDPADTTIYRTPEAARAVATGIAQGPVVAASSSSPKRLHGEIACDWLRRWTRGEFGSLGALDEALAGALGCSTRWARRVRGTWGLRARVGRPNTAARPHLDPDDKKNAASP